MKNPPTHRNDADLQITIFSHDQRLRGELTETFAPPCFNENGKIMSRAARNLNLFLITVLLFGVLSPAHAQTLTPIHIGVSTNSATWFPLYVAWKKGLFREQGLE